MNAALRARAYLAKVPPAVAGQRGHASTFQAACRLVEFGLSWEEAWPLFLEWNSGCQPPWSESELHHKLADAYRRTKPRPDFSQRNSGPRRPWQPSIPPAPRSATVCREASTLPAAADRPKLPPLEKGTKEMRQRLADVRGLSIASVELAVARGLVRFGLFRMHPAWFALDDTGRIAQARRLDGQPWAEGVKAWTLRHSQARWPVGIEAVKEGQTIHLVEGGPDILALLHLASLACCETETCPVAMLAGAARFHPDALPRFAGRRVVCHPHADEAGQATGRRWQEDLCRAGALDVRTPDYRRLARPNSTLPKDLNELAREIDPAKAASLFPI